MREELARLLGEREYNLGGESNSGKKVKRFDKEQISKTLFNVIKSEQIFRVLGNFLFRNAVLSVDKLAMEINKSKLDYTMTESIIKKAVCEHCKNEILFPKFDSVPNTICQKCGKKCYKIEDDWELKLDTHNILIYYLNKLRSEGIVSKYLEASCPACLTKAEYHEEQKLKGTRNFLNELICKKCDGIKEIKWVYSTTEPIINFWENDGTWLEWYVKYLLQSKGFEVIQGVKLKDKNNKETEVDCLTVKSGKIISISCKAASFNNTYDKEPDISKLIPFSDYVIFITTTKIIDNIKSRYKKINPKCKKIFIDGSKIEELPEIIDKIS